MKPEDFSYYQELLIKKSGIYLTEEKTYLLTTRLSPLGKTLGYESLENFTQYLRSQADPMAITAVVEAMTTNETSFFRDVKPYQHLKDKILPQILVNKSDSRSIRIWCAACSTGQEPYSIAMTIREMKDKFEGWSIEIIGTDIADNVLKKARDGEYNNFEIQRGLSMPVIIKNFVQRDNSWIIHEDIKKMVRFSKFNLMDNPVRLGMFDIVFCRNVLIYFSPEVKLGVLLKLKTVMAEHGFLFLGSCENAMNDKSGLQYIEDMHGVYKK